MGREFGYGAAMVDFSKGVNLTACDERFDEVKRTKGIGRIESVLF